MTQHRPTRATSPTSESRAPRTARAAAALAVQRAVAGEQYVREALAALTAARPLDPRDAGLAAEIALGTVRHWITIESVLSRAATLHRERTPAALRAILATGAFQLIWLDRVPVHAAVGETVTVARDLLGPRPAGMANAVLRNVARAVVQRRGEWIPDAPRFVRTGWESACIFGTNVLPPIERPADRAAHVAAAAGERPDRLALLARRYGLRAAEQCAWASQAIPPTVLQRNLLRISAADFAARIHADFGPEAELGAPSASPPHDGQRLDSAFLPPSAALSGSSLLRDGLAWVQDSTARAAADLLAAQPGETILDLCAAPGGKSIALAVAMQDRGRIVAGDIAPARLARIAENAARLALRCIEPHLLRAASAAPAPPTEPEAQARAAATIPDLAPLPDPSDPGASPAPCALRPAPAVDAALVDVPCSNSGVLARRPEARFRLTPAHRAALRPIQLGLLEQAAAAVRPAGRLVYSTCSIDPAENEELVAAFLQAHPAWRLAAERTTLPHWGPRLADWRDGGYAALLAVL